jgi:predicted PurR-regulated permease PerM
MRDYLVVFWPTDRQSRVSRLANEMGARLGHWAIGQAVLCVVIGGGAWLGLQLIGVPYAALLGLVCKKPACTVSMSPSSTCSQFDSC